MRTFLEMLFGAWFVIMLVGLVILTVTLSMKFNMNMSNTTVGSFITIILCMLAVVIWKP